MDTIVNHKNMKIDTNTLTDFEQHLIASMEEFLAHTKGKSNACRVTTFKFADARSIRENMSMSQREFSEIYGIPIKTLQHWEQRCHNPDSTASASLWTIEEFPSHVRQAQERHHKRSETDSHPEH